MTENPTARNIIHSLVAILNLFLIFLTYRYFSDINTLGDKSLSVLYFIIFVSFVCFIAGILANKNWGSISMGQIRNLSKYVELYIPIIAILLSVFITITY